MDVYVRYFLGEFLQQLFPYKQDVKQCVLIVCVSYVFELLHEEMDDFQNVLQMKSRYQQIGDLT